MTEVLGALGGWVWWLVAGALLLLELAMPGVFFIWLAIAAALVAVIDLSIGLSWQMEILAFSIFAVGSVAVGRAVMKRRRTEDSDQPHLNRRLQGYVGQRYTLAEPIRDGRGKLTIEDTVWDIRGADAPKGAHVQVTGVDGMRLLVERV